MMIKVQEHLKETIDWKEVRNIIVKLNKESHLSDSYWQINKMHASVVQSKACSIMSGAQRKITVQAL